MALKDFKAMGEIAVKESGKDMTVAQAGGGDYEPPKAGFCFLRLVGYFEIGKQAGTYQGKPTLKDKVLLVIEVSGPNHPPTVLEDGTKLPHRITIEETYSLSEKARFFKLFRTMNYAGQAKHMVQLMGEAFKGSIIHREYTGRDGKKRIAVELYDKTTGAFTIAPPRTELIDPDTGVPTGQIKVLDVPQAITPLKAFLWDYSDLDDWKELFIDGEYPERKDDKGVVTAKAKSKNVIQNKIKQAANFKGSNIYNLLLAAGANLDIPEADDMTGDDEGEGTPSEPVKQAPLEVPTGAAADDALNSVV